MLGPRKVLRVPGVEESPEGTALSGALNGESNNPEKSLSGVLISCSMSVKHTPRAVSCCPAPPKVGLAWPRSAPPYRVAFRGHIPTIQGQNSLRAHESAVPCSSQPPTHPGIWETEARHSKQGCQGLANSSQPFSAWSGSGRAHLSMSLILRGACASSFIHLFRTGNPENPPVSPCFKGRGCSDWDSGVAPLGCARPQCQVCLITTALRRAAGQAKG